MAVAVFLYFFRMFAVTGCYHRYTDRPEDPHSPVRQGFWVSHLLWWGQQQHLATRKSLVPDLCTYPELVFLDRFHFLAPWALGFLTLGLGLLLQRIAPGLGTTGPQMFVWGFVVSTVALVHGVASINSVAHLVGRRRYATADNSRNSFWLALATMGEGWHNNHHHFPVSARQGFYWWEIDLSIRSPGGSGPSPPGVSMRVRRPAPVVGVGASAGGVDAFTQLLSQLPDQTGMAFVLVQHLDPTHDSHLADLFRTRGPGGRRCVVPGHPHPRDPVRKALVAL